MGNRRKARELALKVLFQVEFTGQGLGEVLPLALTEEENAEVKAFAEELSFGTFRNLREIDSAIEVHSTNWKLNRMASVDRNILRLGVYEILYAEGIPVSVSINEALEIAKKYGTEESAGFINGILDKIAKEK